MYWYNHNGSIDEPVEDGDTVLHMSCLYGHFPCVQLILEVGASLESRMKKGLFLFMMLVLEPLHHAARGEHLDVVRLLPAAGASPNKTNMFGKIPAELADQDTEVPSILTVAAAGDTAVAM
ncbi:hypothetical protein Cni_G24003 [Canna indica]|uniref:Uncharacterized protein n=1 Tax=Canna indica TaxID=4628 RepID=A0AAQ3KU53_9LILI|nr:hypothetical protein Cni_G24003 [Canna indica]